MRHIINNILIYRINNNISLYNTILKSIFYYTMSAGLQYDKLSVYFFQTNISDALLMLASSEKPGSYFLSIALDSLGLLRAGGNMPNFEEDISIFVDGVAQDMYGTLVSEQKISSPLNDKKWHTVKIIYTADEGAKILWNPEIFFGNSPNLNQGNTIL